MGDADPVVGAMDGAGVGAIVGMGAGACVGADVSDGE